LQEKKIPQFQKKLLFWYNTHRRSLPWRDSDDSYAIWISEVMLQQTQVKTVIPYYEKFMKRFPDINGLATAQLQDVLKLWEGLGYYARARNLHRAAQRLISDYQGKVPPIYQSFRSLPGVGDYISAAVLSIAFGQPFAVVDGNVKRFLARLDRLDVPVNQPASYRVYRLRADRLLYRKDPGEYNQAVMELGALVCTPRQPTCDRCPISDFCRSFQAGCVDRFPKRVDSRPVPEYRIAVGVVIKAGRLLIAQRKPDGLLGGLWEFPGGKVKSGESSREACVREIKEELNLDVDVAAKIGRVRHAYTHFKIDMDVFVCEYRSGRVCRNGPVDHKWISLKGIEKYPIPGANHKIMRLLKAYLQKSSVKIIHGR